MGNEVTVQPQSPVDVTVEPGDVIEVPVIEGDGVSVVVEPPCGTEVQVETSNPPIEALVQTEAPVLDAQVTPGDNVEAQVITGGFITLVQDGGDVGFVEWAEYDYTDVGINLVRVLLAGNVVTAVKIAVLEAFDGAPTLKVGTAADDDFWLSLGAVELGQLCEYHNESMTPFAVAERINLTLAAPGSTQGRVGLLYRVIL